MSGNPFVDLASTPHTHAVQLYSAPEELTNAVTQFVTAGFAAGQASLVVGTPQHVRDLHGELRDRGWDPTVLEQTGRLTVLDAETLLDRIMDGAELPSQERFTALVGGALDQVEASSHGPVRVFGEMVDLLCERGAPDAAAALEDLWNELALHRPFALLCGYCVDVFDHTTQRELLPQICSSHTHVEVTADPPRLDRAVDAALVSELGPTLATKVGQLIERERDDRVSVTQRTLMWVSANMPGTARRVLETARSEYAG